MLRNFLRYPGVFKKSVQGKMCLFYRNLKLCPRENFLKMLPEGAILWVWKTPVYYKVICWKKINSTKEFIFYHLRDRIKKKFFY